MRTAQGKGELQMEIRPFGRTDDGREARLFTLKNSNGMEVDITDFGGIIRAIRVPYADGITDVVLGYDDAAGYEEGTEYIGATVGPSVGQIRDARIELDGVIYELTKNGPAFNMHGGEKGFSYRYFEFEGAQGDSSITLRKVRPHLEEGFPGQLDLKVTFTLTDANELVIRYEAVTDRPTVLNVTNHSYFNLDGCMSDKDILDHYLTIDAGTYSETDGYGMPTGNIIPVAGTPMDFRTPHTVGERIDADYEALKLTGGYDQNYDLHPGSLVREAAGTYTLGSPCCTVENWDHTRRMEVYTDYPGVQLYAGNSLYTDMGAGKGGKGFFPRQALCLETQFPTNAPACPNFPSIVLRPGEKYDKITVYRFPV